MISALALTVPDRDFAFDITIYPPLSQYYADSGSGSV